MLACLHRPRKRTRRTPPYLLQSTSAACCSALAVVSSRFRCSLEQLADRQGPSWPLCMRGAEAREVASGRHETRLPPIPHRI
jgi:hypothetical protein